LRRCSNRRAADRSGNVIEDVGRDLVEQHIDDHEQPETEALRIEPGAEPGDQPVLQESASSFAGGGWGTTRCAQPVPGS
jgi:hypothetical protein